MKKLYATFRRLLPILCAFSIGNSSTAQNLIVNPGAEDGAPASTGWTAISSGSDCYTGSGWRITGNQNGYPVAGSGSFLFFPGCGGNGTGDTYELFQDVNVSTRSATIDARAFAATFTGYIRTFAQTPSDLCRITVEYRDAANTTVLASFTSGAISNLSIWQMVSNSRIAPIGTRFIRIRLIATSQNGDSIDGYFDDISLTATNLLPVNMLQFNATPQADAVSLQWTTDMEINNKGFNIFRSPDGKDWLTIGFVPAQPGEQALKQYKFIDQSPLAQYNYYQVQQVDLDGKFNLSEIKSLRLPAAGKVFVYPNPVANRLFIKMPRSGATMDIINHQGQTISRQLTGSSVNTSHLLPGTYILKVKDNEKVEFKQFIKR